MIDPSLRDQGHIVRLCTVPLARDRMRVDRSPDRCSWVLLAQAERRASRCSGSRGCAHGASCVPTALFGAEVWSDVHHPREFMAREMHDAHTQKLRELEFPWIFCGDVVGAGLL